MSVYYPNCYATLNCVFEGFVGDDSNPIPFPVRPTRARVQVNPYHQADTWEIGLNAKDLPFDPDLIRAGQIDLYIFDAHGVGVTFEEISRGRDPTIAGLFDDDSISYDEQSRTVSISGRDFTAQYLDRPWRRQGQRLRKIPTGRRLDILLEELMAEAENKGRGDPTFLELEVQPLSLRTGLPVVGRNESKVNRKGIAAREKDSYWDVMYDLAHRYGFIIFVRGHNVILSQPRTFVEGKTAVKRLTWGRNLTHLSMRRKMGKEVTPQIRVRSYNDVERKTIEGRFPEKNQTVKDGIGVKRDEFKVHTVDGIRDIGQLRQIAESIYYQISRSEREVLIKTDELLDETGADLIQLAAGDALDVKFDQFNEEEIHGLSVGQRTQYLLERGYELRVAQVIATNLERVTTFRQPFRVKEATIDYDVEAPSLTIEAQLQNFVRVEGIRVQ